MFIYSSRTYKQSLDYLYNREFERLNIMLIYSQLTWKCEVCVQ